MFIAEEMIKLPDSGDKKTENLKDVLSKVLQSMPANNDRQTSAENENSDVDEG